MRNMFLVTKDNINNQNQFYTKCAMVNISIKTTLDTAYISIRSFCISILCLTKQSIT